MFGGPCVPGLGGRAAVAPVAGYSELLDASLGVVHFDPERYVESWMPTGALATQYLKQLAGAEPRYEFGGYNGAPSICASRASGDRMVAESAAVAAAMSGLNIAFTLYLHCQFNDSSDEAIISMGNIALTNNWSEFIAATTGNQVKIFNVDSAGPPGNVGSALLSTNDGLRHLWRVVFTGNPTNLITVERDGTVLLNAVGGYSTPLAQAFTRLGLFYLARSSGGNNAKGRIHKLLRYVNKGSETADERLQNIAWMNAACVPAAGKSFAVIVGDSTSRTRDGVDTLEPGSWAGLMSLTNTVFSNTSIGGHSLTVDAIPNQLRDVNSNYSSGYSNDAVVLMLGLNDYNNARTGAQFTTDVQTWITSSKAANPTRKVIVCTTSKSALIVGSENTQRLAGNALILADAVSSWGADAAYDLDAALPEPTSDATIYSDGTHWTTLACQRVATGIQAVLSGFGFT